MAVESKTRMGRRSDNRLGRGRDRDPQNEQKVDNESSDVDAQNGLSNIATKPIRFFGDVVQAGAGVVTGIGKGTINLVTGEGDGPIRSTVTNVRDAFNNEAAYDAGVAYTVTAEQPVLQDVPEPEPLSLDTNGLIPAVRVDAPDIAVDQAPPIRLAPDAVDSLQTPADYEIAGDRVHIAAHGNLDQITLIWNSFENGFVVVDENDKSKFLNDPKDVQAIFDMYGLQNDTSKIVSAIGENITGQNTGLAFMGLAEYEASIRADLDNRSISLTVKSTDKDDTAITLQALENNQFQASINGVDHGTFEGFEGIIAFLENFFPGISELFDKGLKNDLEQAVDEVAVNDSVSALENNTQTSELSQNTQDDKNRRAVIQETNEDVYIYKSGYILNASATMQVSISSPEDAAKVATVSYKGEQYLIQNESNMQEFIETFQNDRYTKDIAYELAEDLGYNQFKTKDLTPTSKDLLYSRTITNHSTDDSLAFVTLGQAGNNGLSIESEGRIQSGTTLTYQIDDFFSEAHQLSVLYTDTAAVIEHGEETIEIKNETDLEAFRTQLAEELDSTQAANGFYKAISKGLGYNDEKFLELDTIVTGHSYAMSVDDILAQNQNFALAQSVIQPQENKTVANVDQAPQDIKHETPDVFDGAFMYDPYGNTLNFYHEGQPDPSITQLSEDGTTLKHTQYDGTVTTSTDSDAISHFNDTVAYMKSLPPGSTITQDELSQGVADTQERPDNPQNADRTIADNFMTPGMS